MMVQDDYVVWAIPVAVMGKDCFDTMTPKHKLNPKKHTHTSSRTNPYRRLKNRMHARQYVGIKCTAYTYKKSQVYMPSNLTLTADETELRLKITTL